MANHRRSEWSDVNAWFAPMGQADGIAIHHTASIPRMDSFDPDYLRRIERAEINNGYNALAYHTMFMADGDSAESRPYGSMGAATGGHNGHTIAFCVPGYFHAPYNDESTTALEQAMACEIQELVRLGFLSPNYVVMGHRDWTAGTQWATACPGDLLYPRVEVIDALSRGGAVPAPAAPSTDITKDDSMRLIKDVDTGNWWLFTALGWRQLTAQQTWDFAVAGIPKSELRGAHVFYLAVQIVEDRKALASAIKATA